MSKVACALLAVFSLVPGASAQTTNPNYEVVQFGSAPDGNWGDTISVAADGEGSILVLRRADPPVLVFDREGRLQHSWGDGLFPNNYSIDVGPEGFVWITDRTHNMAHKFTIEGEHVMSLGTRGSPGTPVRRMLSTLPRMSPWPRTAISSFWTETSGSSISRRMGVSSRSSAASRVQTLVSSTELMP